MVGLSIPIKLPLWFKISMILVPVIILAGTIFVFYSKGFVVGKAYTQTQWDIQKAQDQKIIQDIKDEYVIKEKQHIQESQRISDELISLKENTAQNIAAINTEYVKRLSVSTQRATIYQRQAEAGASQCSSLASFTTQLDANTEEGIRVVGELQETLRQRDEQLKLLGAQISSDRKAIE